MQAAESNQLWLPKQKRQFHFLSRTGPINRKLSLSISRCPSRLSHDRLIRLFTFVQFWAITNQCASFKWHAFFHPRFQRTFACPEVQLISPQFSFIIHETKEPVIVSSSDSWTSGSRKCKFSTYSNTGSHTFLHPYIHTCTAWANRWWTSSANPIDRQITIHFTEAHERMCQVLTTNHSCNCIDYTICSRNNWQTCFS